MREVSNLSKISAPNWPKVELCGRTNEEATAPSSLTEHQWHPVVEVPQPVPLLVSVSATITSSCGKNAAPNLACLKGESIHWWSGNAVFLSNPRDFLLLHLIQDAYEKVTCSSFEGDILLSAQLRLEQTILEKKFYSPRVQFSTPILWVGEHSWFLSENLRSNEDGKKTFSV